MSLVLSVGISPTRCSSCILRSLFHTTIPSVLNNQKLAQTQMLLAYGVKTPSSAGILTVLTKATFPNRARQISGYYCSYVQIASGPVPSQFFKLTGPNILI